MRIFFIVLSFLGFIPSLVLVLLTFIGFPRFGKLTEQIVGPEPEVVSYYTITNSIMGQGSIFEIVPRKLPHKILPATIIFIGICLQIFGIILFFISRAKSDLS